MKFESDYSEYEGCGTINFVFNFSNINVLITRPKEQAKELTQIFENVGFKAFIEPLFSVKKLPVKKISMPVSAAIITSINACFALKEAGLKHDIKIFTVGKKTAQKLCEEGFKNVIISPQNSAQSLQNLVLEEKGDVLYFHGSVISFNFKNVKKIHAYETHEIENFSTEFLAFVQENFFDEILIFSQNSATIFFKLAQRHNLLEYFPRAQILCISDNVADYMKRLGFTKVKIFNSNPVLKKFYE
ncbi:MAG: hypothetical protein A2794_04725 [Alphaproteobacteria bacterium RIFCSPHIGHO2_01_FULL_40_8]|nr:MAG: hypothetical protein A2794_04725 [Alphaproteobacteria bacterium RIFCSPHIGHO2_01_FULL_40_8]